ncbi:MAG: cell envelope integrity protein TolA [Gammaproteobacteria bacterium]|nr:cell envelope integrity protein TolA [Gammaproteobacteria bacterium]
MAAPQNNDKYFFVSIVFHIGVLLVLVFSFESSSVMPVFENTNKNDVISAVVLGDSPKSKILPKQLTPQPMLQPVKEIPHPEPQPVKSAPVEMQKDKIALKKAESKKKLAEQRVQEVIKQKDLFGKDLLADIKKLNDKQKKLVQKREQLNFQKVLREQAEKSLRQQLLNEEIKLQGTQIRQSSGQVNKYKALILQAISEHWVIPTQANKHLYCELMIRVAPGGMVLEVQVTRTSGDPSLDSSARAAVLKASPLPVPSDPGVFEAFRQFVLKVKPENILDG